MVFRSKLDWWLGGVLVGAAALSLFAAWPLLSEGRPGATVGLLGVLAGVGLPGWIVTTTRYALSDDELTVISGPFRWRVPIAEIRSVTPTRNPLSSPALSLDRLRIDYGGRSIMISPTPRDQFLHELEARRTRAGAQDRLPRGGDGEP